MHEIYTIPDKTVEKLPHVVLLHGFGGTGMTFVRIFEKLRPYAQVHALDLYGMGYSSRGNFNDKFTAEETIDYFVNSL